MKTTTLVAALLALALAAGCSKEDEGLTGPGVWTPADSTWSDGFGGYLVRLNATAAAKFRYYSLVTRQVVDITDAAAPTNRDWTIAWSRVNGKLNGGDAGPLNVKAVDLAHIGNPDSVNFDNITAVPTVADSLWEEDAVNLVFKPWYSYDPAQHQLVPSRNLFVMKTATGKYAKVVVDSLRNPAPPPNMGTIVLKYVYQADGSINLSGETQYAAIVGTSGSVVFSFAAGGAVNVADPITSTAWDIWFDAYDAKTNGGISGPGNAAVYPMYLENNDFTSVTQAPSGTGQGGYFADNIESVFGAPTVPGSEWYDYNPVVHEVSSKHHVYLLKLPGGRHFKLQMQNYYLVVSGEVQSGWVQFRIKEL